MTAVYTDAAAVLELLDARLAATRFSDMTSEAEYFFATEGDGLDALLSVDRERVFIGLPREGPAPWNGSVCDEVLRVTIGIRYALTRASRARMLRDIGRLKRRLRWSDTAKGLIRAYVEGTITYSSRVSEAANVIYALIPLTLIYAVDQEASDVAA